MRRWSESLSMLVAGFAAGAGLAAAGSFHQAGRFVSAIVLQSSRAWRAEEWLEVWAAFPVWAVVVQVGAAAGFARAAERVVAQRLRAKDVVWAAALLLFAVGGAAWLWSGVAWGTVLAVTASSLVAGSWLAAALGRCTLDARALAGDESAAHRWGLPGRARTSDELLGVAQAVVIRTALAVAAAWALGSLAPPLVRGAGVKGLELAGAAGSAVCLACGLLYLSGLRQVLLKAQLEGMGVQVSSRYWLSPPKALGAAISGIVLLGVLLPSDVSPVHIRDFNRWMESFTDFVGPYLVPGARARRAGGLGVTERLAQSLTDALFASLSSNRGGERLWTVLQLVLLSALAVGAWRVFRRRDRKPLRPSRGVGTVPLGIGWLLAELKRALHRLLVWFGIRLGDASDLAAGPAGSREGLGARRLRVSLARLPADVIRIYLHVLERLGERGLPRAASETPLEYLARWEKRSAVNDPEAFPALTHLFLDARYGARPQGPEALARARRAASATLRGWRRSGWARRVRSWMDGRRRNHFAREESIPSGDQ